MKKQIGKRLIAFILTVCMVLIACTAVVAAEEVATDGQSAASAQPDAAATVSGYTAFDPEGIERDQPDAPAGEDVAQPVSESVLEDAILKGAVETTPPEGSIGTAKCLANDYLNLRSGPSTDYTIVGTLPGATEVSVYDYSDNNWYNIWYNGALVWASGDYLKVTPNEGVDIPLLNAGTGDGATNSTAAAFVANALAQLGKPYVYGTQGPDTFDCSGFVWYALKLTGYNVMRTSSADYFANYTQWKTVGDNETMLPGDLIFWRNSSGRIYHIGIYIGDGRYVDAGSKGITTAALKRSELAGVRRVFFDTLVITQQAQSLTAYEGTDATFTVAAEASESITYQWYKDNSVLSGATAATLSLTNVQAADQGSYKCVLKSGGLQATSTATLTVKAQPVLQSDHPYADYLDQTWNYTAPTAAKELVLQFSDQTFTEKGYDYIYLIDSTGAQTQYDGDALAGASVTLPGNSFSIRLTSDKRTTGYGFAIETVSVVPLSAGQPDLLGDVDGDGILSAYDALLVLRMAVDGPSFTDAQRAAADVNGDGSVDASDALQIMRTVAV